MDLIVSNAVFHWIPSTSVLFDRLFALLRPGGRLEAQCGGEGNVAEVERAVEALAGDERFAPYLRVEHRAWNFASVGDTELRLARAGFERGACLARALVRSSRPTPGRTWRPWSFPGTSTGCPAALRDDFVDAVLGSAPRPLVIDYVRLNISARRPA